MSLPKVTVVRTDEWAALYRDGVKINEDHQITTEEVLAALGISIKTRWLNSDEFEAVTEKHGGCFPDKLSQVRVSKAKANEASHS